MWESDYPHITSTYPNSWQHVERTIVGLPDEDRKKLLYENCVSLYDLD
jgi:predicted TIM-barrel fold metal-dependent hydrolase